jgi:hypothetical protein
LTTHDVHIFEKMTSHAKKLNATIPKCGNSGTSPVLMASKNDYVRPIIIIEPNYFGLVLSKMNFVKASNPTLNIGYILSICKI